MNLWSAFRPKTLVAALVPVAVGHSLSQVLGFAPALWLSVFCLLSAICIQVATNLFNDAIDFEKGADTESRLGPVRWSQSGEISSRHVFRWATGFVTLAMVFGVPVVLHGGWPFVALGLVSLFLAYSYTGGPFPLAYLGLGDLFVILFFGLFAVGGTVVLHGQSLAREAWVAGLQVGFLATVLIAINNLRDSDTDRQVGKKTLAVRFGDSFVRWEIGLLLGASYLLAFCYPFGFWQYLPWLTLPLAFKVLRQVFSFTEKEGLNETLGQAGLLQLLFGFFLCVGFYFS